MSRYAIIDAGRVTNHIESDAAFAASLGAVPALNSALGDTWDGKTFSTPALDRSEIDAINEERTAKLWQAAHDFEYAAVSGSAIGLLAIGVLQGKPKCGAVQMWLKSIWTLYYTRKASGSTDLDFTPVGACPHSVPELMAELGL